MAVITELNSYHTPSNSVYGLTPGFSAPELRFKRLDNDTADLNNPIPVPASGTNYSWRKYTRLRFTSGLANGVTALYWFADAAPADWLGTVSLFVGTTTAVTIFGTTSDESAQLANTTNANSYTSASPLTINSGTVIVAASVPGFGTQDYVLQQMGLAFSTPAGVKTSRGCKYRYSET